MTEWIVETWHIAEQDNIAKAYTLKDVKHVVVQPGWIHRVLRAIGFGAWVKKSNG